MKTIEDLLNDSIGKRVFLGLTHGHRANGTLDKAARGHTLFKVINKQLDGPPIYFDVRDVVTVTFPDGEE